MGHILTHGAAKPARARRVAQVLATTGIIWTMASIAAEAAGAETKAPTASNALEIVKLGGYETKIFDDSAAEVVAYLPERKRVYVTNNAATAIDILDIAKPEATAKVGEISLKSFGKGVNSVAARGNVVVAAVEAEDKQAPGQLAIFDADGKPLGTATVGALPDMVTITPDGKYALVANEGEPSDDYKVDPPGSVSIVELGAEPGKSVRTVTFDGIKAEDFKNGFRRAKPDAEPAADIEPEYIALSPDGKLAFVTLQENNAIAVIDIAAGKLVAVNGLGFKDWSKVPLDASDKDGAISFATYPVFGMYLPDAIAVFAHGGELYAVTANEGDSRDYEGYSEEKRVAKLKLDPAKFPDAEKLQQESVLGRLKVTTALGNTDADEEMEELYAYGARSITIRKAMTGELVWDSGADFELFTAAMLPTAFNSDDAEDKSFDSRSDDKGPEPEAVAVGEIDGKRYVFVGFERVSGIAAYDITDPAKPQFVTYVNTRNFDGEGKAGTGGDIAPETIAFVPADASPTGEPLLVVGYEVSGSTGIFAVRPKK